MIIVLNFNSSEESTYFKIMIFINDNIIFYQPFLGYEIVIIYNTTNKGRLKFTIDLSQLYRIIINDCSPKF